MSTCHAYVHPPVPPQGFLLGTIRVQVAAIPAAPAFAPGCVDVVTSAVQPV